MLAISYIVITHLSGHTTPECAVEGHSARRDDGQFSRCRNPAKYKARVAVARKLLTLVFYALRDGEVRCLETAA